MLGQGRESEPGCSTRSRDRDASQAAVERSGSRSGCDTQDVLELVARDAEVGSEPIERLAGPEAIEHVVDARTAPLEDRSSEGLGRFRDDLGVLVAGNVDQ